MRLTGGRFRQLFKLLHESAPSRITSQPRHTEFPAVLFWYYVGGRGEGAGEVLLLEVAVFVIWGGCTSYARFILDPTYETLSPTFISIHSYTHTYICIHNYIYICAYPFRGKTGRLALVVLAAVPSTCTAARAAALVTFATQSGKIP